MAKVKDGWYVVKDGVVYEVTPRIGFPFSKTINLATGEVHYPKNADKIRNMTDEELARWIADELIEPGYYEGDKCYELWLDWLKQEVKE